MQGADLQCEAPIYKATRLFDYVMNVRFRDNLKNLYFHYRKTKNLPLQEFETNLHTIEFGKVVTYHELLLHIKSHEALITCSCNVFTTSVYGH